MDIEPQWFNFAKIDSQIILNTIPFWGLSLTGFTAHVSTYPRVIKLEKIGNPWSSPWKSWNIMENHGKIMGKSWENHGKMMFKPNYQLFLSDFPHPDLFESSTQDLCCLDLLWMFLRTEIHGVKWGTLRDPPPQENADFTNRNAGWMGWFARWSMIAKLAELQFHEWISVGNISNYFIFFFSASEHNSGAPPGGNQTWFAWNQTFRPMIFSRKPPLRSGSTYFVQCDFP